MLKTTIKNTVILVFANTSTEEVKRKKIMNGHNLFEHLNQKIFLETKKTGLEVILYSEEFQTGSTFGERFANAIQHVFSKGYQNIIAIGNDSPDLKARHLTIAKENLKSNTLTLGPSLDGGTYLITLSKTEFNKQEFTQLPWQTSKLFVALQDYLEAKNKNIKQLERLKDIDTLTDLHHFLYRYKHTATFLKELILKIISSVQKKASLIIFSYKESQLSLLYNKGSPLGV